MLGLDMAGSGGLEQVRVEDLVIIGKLANEL